MPKTLGLRKKQPDEVVHAGYWGIDFDPDVGADDSIKSAIVTVRDADGDDVTSTLTSGYATISGTQVTIEFIAGTDGATYTAEFEITTDNGATIQAEFDIIVGEIE